MTRTIAIALAVGLAVMLGLILMAEFMRWWL